MSSGTETDPLIGNGLTTSYRTTSFLSGDASSCSEAAGTPQLRRSGVTYSWRHLHAFGDAQTSWRQRLTKSRDGRHHPPHLLKDVSGVALPGELLGVMGPSGAGKTTLLNALMFRAPASGCRELNGCVASGARIAALSAYVQQDDLFVGALTVREHLVFHALLRMDKNIPYKQRMRRVDEVISEFSLSGCQHSTIGIPGRIRGISGGEMKRLSFASEVLTDPPLLLCDEPTSGLDSFMALTAVATLRAMARKGKTVVATVHQPSSELFTLFDKVLLIAEGRVAFLGTSEQALEFFSSMGAVCPENYNPADFFIQLLAVIPGREDECRQTAELICDCFGNTPTAKSLCKAPPFLNVNGSSSLSWPGLRQETAGPSPYKSSWCAQFRAVLWRSWISVCKEPVLIRVRMLQTVMISLLIGLIFFNQHMDSDGVMNINGALIIFVTNMTFQNVFAVITVFCSELAVFRREHFNGMYRTDVYFLSKTLAEAPIFAVIPVIFTGVAYYMVGFNPDPARFAVTAVIAILVTFVATSFGYFVSCISSSISVAMSMAAPLIFPFLLFGGFFLNVGSIPKYLDWISYISWFRYGNEALFINQWAGVDYIDCTNTHSNLTCPANGHVVLQTFDFDEKDFMRDILCLVLLIISFRLLAIAALVVRMSRPR